MKNTDEYMEETRYPGTKGRAATFLATQIRRDILTGKYEPGTYLPTVREFSKLHAMACSTVHRALKGLTREGLISTEARQGFRVRPSAIDPMRGFPIAYVFSDSEDPRPWGSYHQTLLTAFQRASSRRGWTLLATTGSAARSAELLEQLKTARCCGVALDMNEEALIESFHSIGLPVVLVNSWQDDVRFDVVVQDGQQGGLQAAQYLVSRGHKNIGWMGYEGFNSHTMDRYGGAYLGLMRGGCTFAPGLVMSCNPATAVQVARQMLDRPDRPTAVIALWQFMVKAITQVAGELKLQIGKDFDLVGWCIEEDYDDVYKPLFPSQQIPPAVLWSVSVMAETAMDRLSARRANPNLPIVRIKIPTQLKSQT